MKKLFLLFVLMFGLLSFSPIEKPKTKSAPTTTVACKFSQCQAIAKSTGNQCKHCVSKSGDSFCWQHK